VTDAAIISLSAARADDDAAYERERSALFGNSPGEAGVYWGQGMARLIFKYSQRPGWTEQRLADKEKVLGNKGASQSYIHKKIVFGAFLEIIPNWNNGENIRWINSLSEGRFRECWEQTDKAASDDIRFHEVADMLSGPPRPKIDGAKLLAEFGDGKWHRIETVAERLGRQQEAMLKFVQKRHWSGGTSRADAEVKKVGRSFQVRIFPKEKAISYTEIVEELTPIIEHLRTEGKKMMATSTIGAARSTASALQKLLEKWAE
jgi:hypothetical protein